MTDAVRTLKEWTDAARKIVFFGGAGVSTESGIPDFRSTGGLYHQEWKYPPETILSHTFYKSNPEEFFRFYRAKMLCPGAKPNAAHKKLAEWEREGKLLAVVTQNIDGLHQAAGSKQVYELHGSVHRNYCEKCGKFYDLDHILHTTGVPRCDCGGVIKPDVVLYDEPCSALDPISTYTIEETIRSLCDTGLCQIIVTHNMEQAGRVSDRTAFFYVGDMVETGTTQQIFSAPKDQRLADYLTGRFG